MTFQQEIRLKLPQYSSDRFKKNLLFWISRIFKANNATFFVYRILPISFQHLSNASIESFAIHYLCIGKKCQVDHHKFQISGEWQCKILQEKEISYGLLINRFQIDEQIIININHTSKKFPDTNINQVVTKNAKMIFFACCYAYNNCISMVIASR